LADFHGVEPARVVLAASASEFIFRLTGVTGPGPVAVPQHAFGDYATAARGWGRACVVHGERAADLATLRWVTDPSSPLGQSVDPLPDLTSQALTVLDRACEPLRLHGHSGWQASGALDRVFQLWSPNKALGLTGVRAAYAIAPLGEVGAQWCHRLEAACPSWPLGAAGVALLTAWASPAVQHWLADARHTLRGWKQRQTAGFAELGWLVQPSVSNYGLLRPPAQTGMDAATYATQVVEPALAQAGVAWRNTTSFGLPGAWRVSVQPPVAQDHVWAVLRRLQG
jgi:histidinol-phosphate aminotransferase